MVVAAVFIVQTYYIFESTFKSNIYIIGTLEIMKYTQLNISKLHPGT